jgi:hypothetical protein
VGFKTVEQIHGKQSGISSEPECDGSAVKLLATHTLPAIMKRKVAYSITRHDLPRLGSALGYTSKSHMVRPMGLDTFLV